MAVATLLPLTLGRKPPLEAVLTGNMLEWEFWEVEFSLAITKCKVDQVIFSRTWFHFQIATDLEETTTC